MSVQASECNRFGGLASFGEYDMQFAVLLCSFNSLIFNRSNCTLIYILYSDLFCKHEDSWIYGTIICLAKESTPTQILSSLVIHQFHVLFKYIYV